MVTMALTIPSVTSTLVVCIRHVFSQPAALLSLRYFKKKRYDLEIQCPKKTAESQIWCKYKQSGKVVKGKHSCLMPFLSCADTISLARGCTSGRQSI